MRAGRLRHTVTVERPVEAQDTSGGMVRTWAPVVTVRASVEPLRGREFVQASATQSEMDTRIRMRWLPSLADMNTSWRVRHGAVVYNLYSVPDLELRHRELELMAKTGVNKG